MTIVNPLAYTIQNGQAVDAVPVMANLNQIVNNVNANAAPVSGSAAQTFAVANATASNQAVNLGQANSLYAPVAGNAVQTFAVANASTSSQAVNLAQFKNSLAQNGYQKLPSGLIIQWGSYLVANANTLYTIALPIAFPNGYFTAVASPLNNGTSVSTSQSSLPNNHQITLVSSAANISIGWIAIGY